MPTGQTDGDNSLAEILSSQTTSRFTSGWWKWISILGEAKSTSFPQTVRGHLGLEILTSGPVRLLLGLATQFMETKPPSNETPLMVPSKSPLRSQVTHPKTARDSAAMLGGGRRKYRKTWHTGIKQRAIPQPWVQWHTLCRHRSWRGKRITWVQKFKTSLSNIERLGLEKEKTCHGWENELSQQSVRCISLRAWAGFPEAMFQKTKSRAWRYALVIRMLGRQRQSGAISGQSA